MAESVVVGVRVRPFNDREKNLKATVCIDMVGPTTIIKDEDDEEKKFTFDESFWSHDGYKDDGSGYMERDGDSRYADQRFVFDKFGKRVLDNAWAGFHCCLFAYGQTGAGKSYSMVGYGANKGIVPISCEEIFKRIDGEGDTSRRYEVTVSMVEIYNETVQDLFVDPPTRPKKGLEIRESKLLGIYIDGVIKRPVKDYSQIEACIDEATGNRTVGSTLMNATSSRAHTVQTIEFKQVEKTGSAEQTKVSMINLVDLAGSEKAGQTGASGDRLKEGAMINKSLSALGNVIEKLAEKSSGKHQKVVIPYRDSKLTRLLQNALGGSSKTIMICALSPASSNYEETLSTLRYADRAKKIKNTAVVNENPMDKLLRELKQENLALKEMMAKMQSGEGMDAKALAEVSEKQKELEEAQKALDEMSKTFEQRQEEDLQRQRALADLNESKRKSFYKDTVPVLVNLNADPQLTGRTKYQLDPDKVTCIGSLNKKSRYNIEGDNNSDNDDSGEEEEEEDEEDQEPDILLMHNSICYKHATIRNINNECYLQAPPESAPMTFVSGKSLAMLLLEKEDAKNGILLQHGDRVVFGECYFFFADPAGSMAPEIMIATGQVDYTQAQNELFGGDLEGSPWGKTPAQIVSVIKTMKVFAPLVKILEDVQEEHKQLEEAKVRNSKLSQELEEIKPRKTLLEKELQMEHEQLESLKQQMAELEAVKAEKDQLLGRFQEEHEAKVKLEKELAALQTSNAADEAEITQAREAKGKLEKELQELVTEKEGMSAKLEAEVSEAQARLQQEQAAKANLLLLLQAKKPESEAQLTELEEAKSKLEKELLELKAEKDGLSDERDTLEKKLESMADKDSMLSKLQAELAALSAERDTLEKELEKTADKEKELGAMADKDGMLSKLEAELAEVKLERDSLSAQARQELEAKAKLEGDLAKTRNAADVVELVQVRGEAERARDEAAKMQQELQSTKGELESTKQKLDAALKKIEEVPADSPGVSFDQAIEALDLVERTLRELETKKKAPGAASEEYPMF